ETVARLHPVMRTGEEEHAGDGEAHRRKRGQHGRARYYRGSGQRRDQLTPCHLLGTGRVFGIGRGRTGRRGGVTCRITSWISSTTWTVTVPDKSPCACASCRFPSFCAAPREGVKSAAEPASNSAAGITKNLFPFLPERRNQRFPPRIRPSERNAPAMT